MGSWRERGGIVPGVWVGGVAVATGVLVWVVVIIQT